MLNSTLDFKQGSGIIKFYKCNSGCTVVNVLKSATGGYLVSHKGKRFPSFCVKGGITGNSQKIEDVNIFPTIFTQEKKI